MRRLIGLLALAGFTNLSFVQATASCPLANGSAHAPAAKMVHDAGGEHAGHMKPASPAPEGVDEPRDQGDGHANCFMTGPCGLSADVGGVMVATLPATHNDRVLSGSDRVPPSLTTSPDIPPPKA